MEGTEQGTAAQGRTLYTLAYGNTADEVELDALDQARKAFGPDIQLRVERNYGLQANLVDRERGQWFAGVRVHVIEPPSEQS